MMNSKINKKHTYHYWSKSMQDLRLALGMRLGNVSIIESALDGLSVPKQDLSLKERITLYQLLESDHD